MKKIGLFLICILLLQACSTNRIQEEAHEKKPEVDESTLPTVPPVTTPKEISPILLASSSFHSVIGWLSNDEVAFILVENGKWTVQSYTVSNGTWKTIYTTTTPIIQGIIHPNKELILLHTSNNSSSAEIQIIHKNGYLVQSLSFESSELYMDWNPTNSDLIVFTTFYEDWTYNTFIYDATTQNLQSIEVENPFVKWFDEHYLMVLKGSDSSLDGNELLLYSVSDQSLKETGISHVVDVQNLGESMLYVQINEQEKLFEYSLKENDTENSFEWSSPAVSNYSEWMAPIISVVNPQQLIMIKAVESGNVDEIENRGLISSISLNGEKELGETVYQPIACAPNGEVCLGGYEKENWIQLYPLEEKEWIRLSE